jgi:adenosylcobyric acid synthase
MIAERTGVPVLGVVPMVLDLQVKEEDGMSVERQEAIARGGGLTAAVVRLPRISNFDDFDPLSRAGVRVLYVTRPEELRQAHIVVLPGTKNTIADLRWMKSRGLDAAVKQAAVRGAVVAGICGGYQMLGTMLDDPYGADSGSPGSEPGLGLLPVKTVFSAEKATRRVRFRVVGDEARSTLAPGSCGVGYEIHTGRTVTAGGERARPLLELTDNEGHSWPDGVSSVNGNVFGCYVHGLFDSPEVLGPFLASIARRNGMEPPEIAPFSMEEEFDRMAGIVRSSLDMDAVRHITGCRKISLSAYPETS